jgi:hypothetical protein
MGAGGLGGLRQCASVGLLPRKSGQGVADVKRLLYGALAIGFIGQGAVLLNVAGNGERLGGNLVRVAAPHAEIQRGPRWASPCIDQRFELLLAAPRRGRYAVAPCRSAVVDLEACGLRDGREVWWDRPLVRGGLGWEWAG